MTAIVDHLRDLPHGKQRCDVCADLAKGKIVSAPRLHLLMSVSRPWNLPALVAGYLQRMEPHPFELRWHLLVQGPMPDPKGVLKQNEALESITDGWILFPADDTIPHPAMFRRLGEAIAEDDKRPGLFGAGAFVFRLNGPGGEVPATMELAREGKVGAAQVALHRSFIGSKRFNWKRDALACDTVFVRALALAKPKGFRFIDEPLATFNSLEWLHDSKDFVPARAQA